MAGGNERCTICLDDLPGAVWDLGRTNLLCCGKQLHIACGKMLCKKARRSSSGRVHCPNCRHPIWQTEKEREATVRKNAERGRPWAQHILAQLCCHGNGVKRDRREAFELWSKAAAQGHVKAQCCLAECYFYGKGVARDAPTAVEW